MNTETDQITKIITENDIPVSISVTKDSKYLLVNTSFKVPELHLWDLQAEEIVSRYSGHFQEKYLLKCQFGGKNDMFVSCGSEDG